MGYHSFLKQKIDNLINYYTSQASVQCGGSYIGNGEYRHILKNRKDITKLLLFDSAPEVIVDQNRLRLPLSVLKELKVFFSAGNCRRGCLLP